MTTHSDNVICLNHRARLAQRAMSRFLVRRKKNSAQTHLTIKIDDHVPENDNKGKSRPQRFFPTLRFYECRALASAG